MTVRFALIAGVVAACALAGCGSDGGTDPSRFLPRGDAAALESLVRRANSASERGDCDAASTAVQDARARLDGVPATVSKRLTRNIDEWLVYLGERIGEECGQQEEDPSPTASPTEEPTETPDKTTEESPTPSPTPDETETPTPSPTTSPEPTPSPTTTPDPGGAIGEPGDGEADEG